MLVPLPADLPGDAIVVRFPPATAEGALRRAERDSRLSGAYRLSVFVGVAQGGEGNDEVIERLLRASELSIDPVSNRKFFVCSRADRLAREGFTLVKDGYEGELAEHFSVDLGPGPTLEDVQRFLGAFDQERRRQS